MAIELATAYVAIVPSAQGIARNLGRELGGPLERAGRDAGTRSAKEFGGRFTFGLRGIAGVAAGVLGGTVLAQGLASLTRGAKSFITEAQEAAKVGRLTEAVLKSTGGVAHVSADQIGELATRLSNLSGVDDELIQSSQNVLLTFTKVRNELGKGNDVFNQGAEAALNMSAALGTDLQGATIQVGKALQDPVKGLLGLTRAGVQFTEQQKEQVKALVASGDQLGAQKVILAELTTQFAGAATAAADPLTRLSVIAGNFKEQLGGALLPVIGQVADSLGTLLPVLADSLTPLVQSVVPAIVGAFSAILPALTPIVQSLSAIVGPLLAGVGTAIAEAFAALAPTFAAVQPVLAGLAGAFGQILQSLVPLLVPIGDLVAAVAPLAVAFADVATTVAQALVPVVGPLLDLLAALAEAFIGTVSAPGPLVQILSQLGSAFADLLEAIGPTVKQVGTALAPVFATLASTLSEVAPLFGTLGTAAARVLRVLTPILPVIANLVADLVEGLAPILPPIVKAFGQIAVALAGALGGALKTIIPAVGKLVAALAPVLPVVADLVVDLVQGLAPVLPKLAAAFSDLVVALAPLLPQLVQLAVLLIEKIGIPTIVLLATAFAELATALVPLVTNTKVLVPLVVALASAFAAVKVTQGVTAAFAGISAAAGRLGGTVTGATGAVQGFFKAGGGKDTVGIRFLQLQDAIRGVPGALRSASTAILNFSRASAAAAIATVRQTTALVAQKVAAIAAAAAQKVLTVAQLALNLAMTANPIGAIVVAVAALAAGIVYAYKNFKPFRDIVDAVGRALRRAFDWVKDNWPKLLIILTGPFGLAVVAIVKHFDKVRGVVTAVFNFIRDHWKIFAVIVAPFIAAPVLIAKNLDKIRDFITGVFDFIKDRWKLVLALLIAPFVAAPVLIVKNFGKIISGIQTVLAKLGGLFTSLGPKLLRGLATGLTFGLKALAVFFVGLPIVIVKLLVKANVWLLRKGAEVIAGLVSGLVSALPTILRFFVGLPARIVGAIIAFDKLLIEAGGSLIVGLFSGIAAAWDVGFAFFAELPGRILEGLGAFGDLLVDVGSKIISGLWTGIRTVWETEVRFLASIPGRVAGFFTDAVTWLRGVGLNIIQGLFNGLIAAAGFTSRAAGSLAGYLISFPGKLIAAIGDAAKWLYNAGKDVIAGLLKGMADAVKAAPGFIKDKIVDPIKNFVTDPFGIFSPSRWAIGVGANITEGLVLGLRRGVVNAKTAAQTLFDTVRAALDQQSPALAGVVDAYLASLADIPAAKATTLTLNTTAADAAVSKLQLGVFKLGEQFRDSFSDIELFVPSVPVFTVPPQPSAAGGAGFTLNQTNHFEGVPLDIALDAANRKAGMSAALLGRR